MVNRRIANRAVNRAYVQPALTDVTYFITY